MIFLVITGLVAVVSQTVILRELLSLCQGSEITLGFGLAAWLAGGAAGSLIAGRVQRSIGCGRALSIGFILLTVLCPGSLILIRNFRYLAGALPGQFISLGQVAIVSVSTLFPLGALISALYCFGVGWLERSGQSQPAGRGYGLEALGFLAGGLLFTFWLSIKATATASLLLCSGLCLLGYALVSPALGLRLGSILLSALILMSALLWGPRAEIATQRWAYPGYDILSVNSSPYGQTVIAQRQEQVSIFYQGGPWLEHPPAISLSDEEIVALGLLASGGGGDVLCLGGWTLLPILLAQRINTVTLAEPDPWLINNIDRQGLISWNSVLADPKLGMVATDGRSFVEKDSRRWRLIIINLPYPQSLGWNRYYTREFFQAARRRLENDGVLVIRLPVGESSLDPNKLDLAAVVQRTLSAVFPQSLMAVGQWLYLIGFSSENSFLLRLGERYEASGLRLSFFSRAQLDHLLDAERRERLVEGIEKGMSGINYDLHPRALVPGLGLWQAMISGFWSRLYRLAVAYAPGLWLLLILLLFWPRWRQTATALGTGSCAMGMQMLCLWGLQIEMGALYHWLGLGNALFMAGTTLGSFIFVRRCQQLRIPILESVWLIWISIFLILTLGRILPGWGYLLGSTVCGLLLGLEYPALVADHALERKIYQAMSVSPVYAADLLGGLIAAILIGMLLIPAWGMAGAAALLLGLKVVSCRWWLVR